MKSTLTALILGCCVSVSMGGIADFYIAGADGVIYSVDGESLAASQVFAVQGGLAINDIIFVGNNKMLANVTDQLIEYDMSTGLQTVVFDTNDYEGEDEFYFTSGFAATSDGNIFMSIREIGVDRNDLVGAVYNPFTHSFTEQANIDANLGLFFDHQEIDENVFLGADFENQSVHTFNSLTGESLALHQLGFGPVSFLELGSDLFLLGKDGELYNYNSSTGVATFYGDISGFSGNLLGAASTEVFRIPAPASLPLFGLASLVMIRRRR